MKRFSFIIALITIVGMVAAKTTDKTQPTEEPLRHYLEVGAAGGVSSFVGNPTQGYFAPGYNVGLGFYYVMRSLPYHVGMRTGLAAESSQSRFRTQGFADKFAAADLNGDPLEVKYSVDNIDETHTQFYFTIPLQFSVFGKNLNFHVGPKVAIALTDFSHQDLYNTVLTCKNEKTGKEYTSDATLAAGIIDQQSFSLKHDKILPKVWLMGSAELSYDVPVNNRYAVNIGLYADYAFNQFGVEKSTTPSLLSLEPNESNTALVRTTTSALRANYADTNIINKFGYFAAGLKVAFKIWE